MKGRGSLAIISDIHANRAALSAVLADARRRGVGRVICLGDLVGYHTQPSQVIERIRSEGIRSVAGNHDQAAVDRRSLDGWGPNGRRAMAWTRETLSPSELAFLADLPLMLRPAEDAVAQHSGLGDPGLRLRAGVDYLREYRRLREHDGRLRVAYVGHSHVPRVIAISPNEEVKIMAPDTIRLRPSWFHFIDAGSVGHPRTGDFRAVYVLHDREEQTVRFRRVRYSRRELRRSNERHGIGTDLGDSVAGHALRRVWDTLRNRIPRP